MVGWPDAWSTPNEGLPTSLLLLMPWGPVDDTELSDDCRHN
jgi:hypothetical protein